MTLHDVRHPEPTLSPPLEIDRPTRKARRWLVGGLSTHTHLHPSATAVSFIVSLMMFTAVLQSRGDWENARMASLITYNVLGVMSSTLFYVTWRVSGDTALGWLSIAMLAGSLSELPFLLLGFVDQPSRVPPGGELQEVVVVATFWFFTCLARRKADLGGISPLSLAVAAALLFGTFRALGLRWNEAELDPGSLLGMTQRLLLAGLLLWTWRNVLALEIPRRIRVALVFVSLSTGLFALTDTGVDTIPATWVTVFTLVYLMFLAEAQLEAGLYLTLRALTRRQDEMTQMAVRAAAAEELVARESAVLDAVRSTVVPLAQASGVLQGDTTLPEDRRDLLADAMRREIDRINRTLGGGGTDPRAFGVDDVVGPLAEFQRAQGHDVVWTPSGLTAVHDPDTVARAIGVSLSAVATQGLPVVVRASPPASHHHPMTIRVFPHGLPAEALSAVFLQEGLAHVDSGSTGLSVSLRSVERLLQAHGGGLRLLVPGTAESVIADAETTGFGIELSLPFRPSTRNLPIPR